MASSPQSSNPASIRVGGKRKTWVAGSSFRSLAHAAKEVSKLRAEQKAGNFARIPKGATVRRRACNVDLYE